MLINTIPWELDLNMFVHRPGIFKQPHMKLKHPKVLIQLCQSCKEHLRGH